MIYKTGAAFRRALEDRLLAQSSRDRVSLVRLRKLVAFDRFLARLLQAQPGAWILKGGLALQLRMGSRARTTQDIDVLWTVPEVWLNRILAAAATLDLGDWFTFTVQPTSSALPGLGEGSLRFSVSARLDGRLFVSFHVDVGSGDPVVEPAERLVGPSLLVFAGIAPVVIPCYPLTQHLAEKVHAYVRPRSTGASTRVKDLVDIVLIAEQNAVDGPTLQTAIQATFEAYGAGEPPVSLPQPPATWTVTFKKLAEEVGLSDATLSAADQTARAFLEPVLRSEASAVWSPVERRWR
jgi:hypothetical protein